MSKSVAEWICESLEGEVGQADPGDGGASTHRRQLVREVVERMLQVESIGSHSDSVTTLELQAFLREKLPQVLEPLGHKDAAAICARLASEVDTKLGELESSEQESVVPKRRGGERSPVFDWTADRLEESTSLERLPARGTLRLALKRGGVDIRNVTRREMIAVLHKVMPKELTSRGIEEGPEVCRGLIRALAAASIGEAKPLESPETIFERLVPQRRRDPV